MNTSGWTKIENEKGFPFYFNKLSGTKQWDHPKYRLLGQRLDDCNYIKYSVYRVAQKFRILQNTLYMDDVPLQIVAGVFDKHRLGANESTLCLESCELEAVLYDIYYGSNKKNNSNMDIDLATDLMQNFLYNVFDPDRKGKIQVFPTKLLLAILSNCDLKDLYKYIFEQCSDHNNCITRQRLQCFLSKITEVMLYLHEDGSYGARQVTMAVENCFLKSPGFVGINETMFMNWVDTHPKIIAWISILFRIKITEPILHLVKCRTCKSTPIRGLRYKCIKCIRYTQCQTCFFTGRTSNTHRLSHSMREYCNAEDNTPVTIKIFKKLCKVLQCVNERDESIIVDTKLFQVDKHCIVFTDNSKELCDIKPMSSPKTQLRLVIKRLETQNKELQQFLLSESLREKDIIKYLEEHKSHISAQVEKLKLLKGCISSSHYSPEGSFRKPTKKRLLESTPLVSNTYKTQRDEHKTIDMCSPIISVNDIRSYQSEKTEEGTVVTDDFCTENNGSVSYDIDDISTWFGGYPTNSTSSYKTAVSRQTSREFHSELDQALAQLQQILANNIGSEDSLSNIDNTNLRFAMTEVEGMLTSFIDSVEHSRANSTRSKNKLSLANSEAVTIL